MVNVRKDAGSKCVRDHYLREDSFINELEHSYHSFLISNYGPHSYLSLIQNSAGGNFLTSSSSLLLQQLSFGHPCFRFINALISSQNSRYGVHGLFVGILCSGLLLRGLKSENVSNRVLQDVSEWIQVSLLEKLQQHYANISYTFNFESLNEILSIAKSIVHSKSFSWLSEKECEHISLKIVDAFLATVPDASEKGYGQVHIIEIEGSSTLNSCIFNGLLYRMPDYRIEELDKELKSFTGSQLKTLIFTVPLSHEVQTQGIIEWHSRSSVKNSYCTALFTKLRDILIKHDVKVIASQMYIQEDLKYLLKKEGFLVLERLGTSLVDSLIKVTKCSPVTSLHNLNLNISRHIGLISAIEVKALAEKTYILIHSQVPHQHLSFALAAENSHTLAYLKECVGSGICVLRELLKNPRVVSGAGCFDVFLAVLLKNMKEDNHDRISKSCNMSFVNVKMIFDVYIDTFLRLALLTSGGKCGKLSDFCVDSEVFHLWRICPAFSNATTSAKNSDSLNNENIFTEEKCCCNCIWRDSLSEGVKFYSLYDIKNSEFKESFLDQLKRNLSLKSISAGDGRTLLRLSPKSIVDSFAAKHNALRLAFDGVSDLLRLGLCIYTS